MLTHVREPDSNDWTLRRRGYGGISFLRDLLWAGPYLTLIGVCFM